MSPARNSAVLVLHAGALGDCVLTLHLVRAMRVAWSHPAITMASRSPIVRWARRRGLLSDACSLDELDAHLLHQPGAELPERSIQFVRSFERIVSFLGGPDDVVAVQLKAVHDAHLVAIDPRPTESTRRNGLHITRQWAAELDRYGCPVSMDIEACEPLDDHQKRLCRAALAERLGVGSAGHVALCHPGSGGLVKCCPIEALEQVVGKLAGDGWTVGWMIGPDEMERFGQEYVHRLEASAPVVYEESVEQAADLVCGAGVYLGQDAGMTHVSALAGVATLAIFGPTDPRVWRPLGCRCRIVPFPVCNGPIGAWVTDIVSCIEAPGLDAQAQSIM